MPTVLTQDLIELHLKGAGVKSVYTQQEMADKFGWVFSRIDNSVKISNAGDADGVYPIGTHNGKPGENPVPVPAIHNVPLSGTTVSRRVTILIK